MLSTPPFALYERYSVLYHQYNTTVCKHVSVTQKTPRGGLLASLPSTLRRALRFWFTKSSVIRQKCLWHRLRMQRTSPVLILVSFASGSGPNDFATVTTALLSSSSIWKLSSPTMTAKLPACELHLSGECNFVDSWPYNGENLL